MMSFKLAATLFAVGLLHTVAAQKSWYASGNNNVIGLHPRYTTTLGPDEIGNRGGDELTTTELPENLRGTLHDPDFVKRVSEWPEDKQPFWFKNRNAINAMRGQEVDGSSVGQNQNPQSPFIAPTQQNQQNLDNQRFDNQRFDNQRFDNQRFDNQNQQFSNQDFSNFDQRPSSFQSTRGLSNSFQTARSGPRDDRQSRRNYQEMQRRFVERMIQRQRLDGEEPQQFVQRHFKNFE